MSFLDLSFLFSLHKIIVNTGKHSHFILKSFRPLVNKSIPQKIEFGLISFVPLLNEYLFASDSKNESCMNAFAYVCLYSLDSDFAAQSTLAEQMPL